MCVCVYWKSGWDWVKKGEKKRRRRRRRRKKRGKKIGAYLFNYQRYRINSLIECQMARIVPG